MITLDEIRIRYGQILKYNSVRSNHPQLQIKITGDYHAHHTHSITDNACFSGRDLKYV